MQIKINKELILEADIFNRKPNPGGVTMRRIDKISSPVTSSEFKRRPNPIGSMQSTQRQDRNDNKDVKLGMNTPTRTTISPAAKEKAQNSLNVLMDQNNPRRGRNASSIK